MERKLVKQGRNALTVTLPADWLRRRGLKTGDGIYLSERDQEIVVSASLRRAAAHATVDARGPETTLVWHLIIGKYIEGNDQITVLHNHPKIVQAVSESLPGMILEQHSDEKSVLRSLIAVPEENMDAVMRRALFILVQQARKLESIAQKHDVPESIKADEKMLDASLLYCLRYLNKYESTENAHRRFLLCTTLESAGDVLSVIALHIHLQPALAKNIRLLIEQYTDLVARNDIKKLYTVLRSFRTELKTKTYLDGITFGLVQTLYNYLGYLGQESIKRPTGK